MTCPASSIQHPASSIESLEARLLPLPQADIPLTHRFAPGVYMREVLMPAGTFVIGHQHKTEHLNIVQTGRARVMQIADSGTERGCPQPQHVQEIVAPYTFVSKPGVRKVLYILEDMRWATIHPTDETDLDRLEELLIIKSEAFLDHQALLSAFRVPRSAFPTINHQPSTINHL